MNKLGRNKTNWLLKNNCVFIEEPHGYDDGFSTCIYTKHNEYVGLADLGKKEDTVNFIYKHRLTNLMGVNRAKGIPNSSTGCNAVSIGFNEKEQAWYGWTHRGYGRFYIGYEIKKDSIMSDINPEFPRIKYPFKCETLEDCKQCAIKIAEELN